MAIQGDLPEHLEERYPGLGVRRPRAVARAVSTLESGGPEQARLVSDLYPLTGRARVLGITGPPGSGKSTLVRRMAQALRSREQTVGILAVDPTSPFSGGALLGDRVRMQDLYTDDGVFIRSMATRGVIGGLARATRDAVDLLDAVGFDWILVETVGVGQDEVDVVRTVDTVLVVTVPGLGDEIQAIKAGIMEIADVFVLNKSDRPGKDAALRDLRSLLAMAPDEGWKPPIACTVASQGEGVEELLEHVDEHRRWLDSSGELEQRRRYQLRLRVENILKDRILKAADDSAGLARELEVAAERGSDPYTVADILYRAATQATAPIDGGQ